MGNMRGSRIRGKIALLLVAATGFAGLVGVAAAADGVTAEPNIQCTRGEGKVIETGIVKVTGCWTSSTAAPNLYTAAYDDQSKPIDLNGFLLTGKSGGGLEVNTVTGSVRTVALAGGTDLDKTQLASFAWPTPGKAEALGNPIKLDFIAPKSGSLVLEDIRFGSNAAWAKALAGFSPMGNVETPVKLEDDGKGSMDLTVELTGIFTLKGKAQSLTVKLPTESGKGTIMDGFELKLNEIDAIPLMTINNLEASYSAAKKELAGKATATFPFTKRGAKGGGFTLGATITNGALTEATVGASGMKIPVGAAGTITALSGGFKFLDVGKQTYDLGINANASADFGPEIPTPWGEIAPISLDAGLKVGHTANDTYFLIDGGVTVFRLPVGNVFLNIHTNSGVEFGAGLGIGLPSFRNNVNDPFYIGVGVTGWIASGKFQFEGDGRIRLFGADALAGHILINDKVIGACWKVGPFPGGAVYPYGANHVDTFGIACGLDRYRENYPSPTGAGVSAARTIELNRREMILAVKGRGSAPRFVLSSPDGRTYRTPAGQGKVIQKSGYQVYVDEPNDTTHFLLRRPAGRWKVTPLGGTVITSLKSGQQLPRERVEARVVGRGLNRTLVWNSTGNPHTRLAFTEKMRGGLEQPILVTGKAKGRYRFKATKGGHYGKRRLRVVVLHGGSPRERDITDRYVVRRPAKLRAPGRVTASRNLHTVKATWTGVPGATGYLAEIVMPKNGKRVTRFARRVGPKARSIVIPGHPGGGTARANVYALNADGVAGGAATRGFPLNPGQTRLGVAARVSAATAQTRPGGVELRTACPTDGHCRTVVQLRHRGKPVGSQRYQQVPDTFQRVRVRPKAPRLRKLLTQGRTAGFSVKVTQARTGEQSTGRAPVRR